MRLCYSGRGAAAGGGVFIKMRGVTGAWASLGLTTTRLIRLFGKSNQTFLREAVTRKSRITAGCWRRDRFPSRGHGKRGHGKRKRALITRYRLAFRCNPPPQALEF